MQQQSQEGAAAIRGGFWTLIDAAGGQALSFLGFILIARLVSPEDYGVLALAYAIITIPSILLNDSVSATLVRHDDLQDRHLNATFWANLALAIASVGLVQLCCGWAALLTARPALGSVLRCLSVVIIFAALAPIPFALLAREMRYSRLAFRTLAATATGTSLGVAAAHLHWGVWALVIMQTTTTATSVVLMWRDVPWRPKLQTDFSAAREVYRFAARVMMGHALRHAAEKSDIIIIGLILDPTTLGYYYLMLRMIGAASLVSVAFADAVMLPVLSRIKDDPGRRSAAYRDMLGAVSALWTPAVAGLAAAAPIIIPEFFGPQWKGAVPMLRIAGFACVAGPLTRTTVHILLAAGRPDSYARLSLLQLVFVLVFFAVGAQFGGPGAAGAYAAVLLAVTPFHLRAVGIFAHVDAGRVVKNHLLPLTASGVMGAYVYAITEAAPADGRWTFVFVATSGMLVYALALCALAPGEVKRFATLVRDAFPVRRKFLGMGK